MRTHRRVNHKDYIKAKREYDMRKRRERIVVLNNYLKSHPCVDCGEPDLIVLDFDHVRGEKVSEVARMFHSMYSMEKVFLEISKCDVVCSNCHRRRTARRGKGWLRSGKL